MQQPEQEMLFHVAGLLFMLWTLPSRSLGLALGTDKTIPTPYQEKCGPSICDTRTQYCDRDISEQCRLCTQGPCAFPDGEQTPERLLGCQITCPVYANTLSVSCPELSVPAVPPTPDAATISDLNDKIGEQHNAIIGISVFTTVLLLALVPLVLYTISLKRKLKRRERRRSKSLQENPIYRGRHSTAGPIQPTNLSPGTSRPDQGDDSGLDTHDSGTGDGSPGSARGTAPSAGRSSGATSRTRDTTAPKVDLDASVRMFDEGASGSRTTNRESHTPMSPTQAVGGTNNPTNGVFHAQPECMPTGKGKHIDVHGNPVPDVTSQRKQAAHPEDSFAHQSINGRYPDRVYEGQPHSDSHWANANWKKYEHPDKYDTDSSTTPLLKTSIDGTPSKQPDEASDETFVKQIP